MIEVEPAFERLRVGSTTMRPREAAKICGAHPDSIRKIARKVAARRTRILLGWTTGKAYHGDLMERAMCLLLGLTGNWGKKGTGTRSWGVGMFDGPFVLGAKSRPGQDATRELYAGMQQMTDSMLAADPSLTPEILMAEFGYAGAATGGSIPPVFFWYHHCGYRDIWNRSAARDPTMKRSFDEYLQEAVDEGWWTGTVQPPPDSPPTRPDRDRRQRASPPAGRQRMLLDNLWPKLELIVSVDWRMTTTGLHSDIVLPAAQHHEKTNFPYTTPDVMNLTLADKAVEPAGRGALRVADHPLAGEEALRAGKGARTAGDHEARRNDAAPRHPLRGHLHSMAPWPTTTRSSTR